MTPRPAVTAEELAHDIPYLAVKFTNRCTNVARLRRVQAFLVRQIQADEAERPHAHATAPSCDEAPGNDAGHCPLPEMYVQGDSGASEGQGR